MVYNLLEMMTGEWLEGETLTRENYGENFISQLADLMAEIHTTKVTNNKTVDIQSLLKNFQLKDLFVYNTIREYHDIKDKLNMSVFLHGDIWAENIIVENGNLQGLIDWEHCAYGDPHWDFRMIRRWIGWDGLDILLFYYNASTGFECKREYVEILDKVSLCNSRQIRSFDNELFNNYINGWPNYQGTT
jgi:aminoglycoside phosphotransferase (APT) family kinase protein